MRLNHLPSILSPEDPNTSAISMERALKQIKRLLEECATEIQTNEISIDEDEVNASIDDINTMLSCIKREDEMHMDFKDLDELLFYVQNNGPIPDGWTISVNRKTIR